MTLSNQNLCEAPQPASQTEMVMVLLSSASRHLSSQNRETYRLYLMMPGSAISQTSKRPSSGSASKVELNCRTQESPAGRRCHCAHRPGQGGAGRFWLSLAVVATLYQTYHLVNSLCAQVSDLHVCALVDLKALILRSGCTALL